MGSEGAWGTKRQQINDYARFRDEHVHNPNCAGGSHRTREISSTTYYPGTKLPTAPKKWSWRDYRAAAQQREREKEG